MAGWKNFKRTSYKVAAIKGVRAKVRGDISQEDGVSRNWRPW